ncbi:hypothetical protein [Janthinobacterium sp. MDT1-19]|uniref:hypothetical protein n=1 Tax=Janthinobacterium sp. MDT1-19 TaxID=1259339 RepID=UPI003F21D187
MQLTEFEGRWAEVGRVLSGELAWLDPGESGLRTHTATVAGKAVATIRTQLFGRGFTVNVPGWVWAKSLDGSAAEKLRIGEVEVKGFTTLREAKQAVKYAIKCLPDPAGK